MKKQKPIMVTIAGKRWRLLFQPLEKEWGFCNPPNHPGKAIVIHSEIESQEKLLEILCHEVWHAMEWSKDEEWVTQAAKDLSKIIVRLVKLGILRLTPEDV